MLPVDVSYQWTVCGRYIYMGVCIAYAGDRGPVSSGYRHSRGQFESLLREADARGGLRAGAAPETAAAALLTVAVLRAPTAYPRARRRRPYATCCSTGWRDDCGCRAHPRASKGAPRQWSCGRASRSRRARVRSSGCSDQRRRKVHYGPATIPALAVAPRWEWRAAQVTRSRRSTYCSIPPWRKYSASAGVSIRTVAGNSCT